MAGVRLAEAVMIATASPAEQPARGVVARELGFGAAGAPAGARKCAPRGLGLLTGCCRPPPRVKSRLLRGVVAQLGERGVRNAEVGSSILLHSTSFSSFSFRISNLPPTSAVSLLRSSGSPR